MNKMTFGIGPNDIRRTAAMTALLLRVNEEAAEAMTLLNLQAEQDPAIDFSKPLVEVDVPEILDRSDAVAKINDAFAKAAMDDGTEGISLVAVPDHKNDAEIDIYIKGEEPAK